MKEFVELANDKLRVKLKPLGAELVSLKRNDDDFEYMWTGDAAFWTGQSPVLFPIVGSVRNETTSIEGQDYHMKNHGFARRSHFEVIDSGENFCVFSLKYDENTLAMYPYRFELRMTYILSEQSVHIKYEVVNLDDKTIYFQLGTHPGFRCPMTEKLSLSDYYLEFSQEESAMRYYCNSNNLVVDGKEQKVFDQNNVLALTPETFYDGALIFRDIKSTSVTLKSDADSRFVRVSWNNFPYLGIWQPKDAPFVCIEPWHGVGDNDTHSVAYRDKEQIVSLEPEQIFSSALRIEI